MRERKGKGDWEITGNNCAFLTSVCLRGVRTSVCTCARSRTSVCVYLSQCQSVCARACLCWRMCLCPCLCLCLCLCLCVDVYVFVSACMCGRRWGCIGGFKTKTSFSRGDSSVQSVFVHIYKSIRVCITRPIYTQAVGRRVSVNRCIVYTRRDKGPDRGLHLARTPLQALRARPGRFCSLPKGSQGRCL